MVWFRFSRLAAASAGWTRRSCRTSRSLSREKEGLVSVNGLQRIAFGGQPSGKRLGAYVTREWFLFGIWDDELAGIYVEGRVALWSIIRVTQRVRRWRWRCSRRAKDLLQYSQESDLRWEVVAFFLTFPEFDLSSSMANSLGVWSRSSDTLARGRKILWGVRGWHVITGCRILQPQASVMTDAYYSLPLDRSIFATSAIKRTCSRLLQMENLVLKSAKG